MSSTHGDFKFNCSADPVATRLSWRVRRWARSRVVAYVLSEGRGADAGCTLQVACLGDDRMAVCLCLIVQSRSDTTSSNGPAAMTTMELRPG